MLVLSQAWKAVACDLLAGINNVVCPSSGMRWWWSDLCVSERILGLGAELPDWGIGVVIGSDHIRRRLALPWRESSGMARGVMCRGVISGQCPGSGCRLVLEVFRWTPLLAFLERTIYNFRYSCEKQLFISYELPTKYILLVVSPRNIQSTSAIANLTTETIEQPPLFSLLQGYISTLPSLSSTTARVQQTQPIACDRACHRIQIRHPIADMTFAFLPPPAVPKTPHLARMAFFSTAYLIPLGLFVWACRDPASVALAERRAENRKRWLAGS